MNGKGFGEIIYSNRVGIVSIGQSSFDFNSSGDLILCTSEIDGMHLNIFGREGNVKFSEDFGATSQDVCRSVISTNDGNIAITGDTGLAVFEGEAAISSQTDAVTFIVTSDTNTVISVYRSCTGSSLDCVGMASAQDKVNNEFYILSGQYYVGSIQLTRLSSSLEVIEVTALGFDISWHMLSQVKSPNYLLAVGAASSTTPFGGVAPINGTNDLAIGIWSPSSNDLISSLRIGSGYDDRYSGVDITDISDTSFVVAAGSYGGSFDNLPYQGGSNDLILSSFSSDLTTLNWHYVDGTSGLDWYDDLVLTSDDNLIIGAGRTTGDLGGNYHHSGQHCYLGLHSSDTGELVDRLQFGPREADDGQPSCFITDLATDPYYGDIVFLASFNGNNPNWISVEDSSTDDFIIVRTKNPNPDSGLPGNTTPLTWLWITLSVIGSLVAVAAILFIGIKVRNTDTTDSKLASFSAQQKFNAPADDNGAFTSFRSIGSEQESWITEDETMVTNGTRATTTSMASDSSALSLSSAVPPSRPPPSNGRKGSGSHRKKRGGNSSSGSHRSNSKGGGGGSGRRRPSGGSNRRTSSGSRRKKR